MKVYNIISLFALSLCFAACARPEPGPAPSETIWAGANAVGTQQYLILHVEDSKWVLSFIEKPTLKLQDVTWEKKYSDRNDAEAAATSIAREHSLLIQSQKIQPDQSQSPSTEVSGEVLWKSNNDWNADWESRYSQWIESAFDTKLLFKNGIANDCADVPYAARWIFSRINHLTMASRLAGTNGFFTNESVRTEWLNLPSAVKWQDDKRFLTALNYVLINTYTHSLAADSYPIEISPTVFTAGAHYLNLYNDSGHTFLVVRVRPGSLVETPFDVMWSSSPRFLRVLWQGSFWEGAQPVENMGGFLKFRWPKKIISQAGESWSLVSPRLMSGYSKEQYRPAFMGDLSDFAQAVERKITPKYDPLMRLRSGIIRLKEKIEQRSEIVQQGIVICSRTDCSKGTRAYADWSTPERDESLGALMMQLDDYVSGLLETRPDIQKAWESALKETVLIVLGHPITLAQIRQTWSEYHYSSEPTDPIEKRWGVVLNPAPESNPR